MTTVVLKELNESGAKRRGIALTRPLLPHGEHAIPFLFSLKLPEYVIQLQQRTRLLFTEQMAEHGWKREEWSTIPPDMHVDVCRDTPIQRVQIAVRMPWRPAWLQQEERQTFERMFAEAQRKVDEVRGFKYVQGRNRPPHVAFRITVRTVGARITTKIRRGKPLQIDESEGVELLLALEVHRHSDHTVHVHHARADGGLARADEGADDDGGGHSSDDSDSEEEANIQEYERQRREALRLEKERRREAEEQRLREEREQLEALERAERERLELERELREQLEAAEAARIAAIAAAAAAGGNPGGTGSSSDSSTSDAELDAERLRLQAQQRLLAEQRERDRIAREAIDAAERARLAALVTALEQTSTSTVVDELDTGGSGGDAATPSSTEEILRSLEYHMSDDDRKLDAVTEIVQTARDNYNDADTSVSSAFEDSIAPVKEQLTDAVSRLRVVEYGQGEVRRRLNPMLFNDVGVPPAATEMDTRLSQQVNRREALQKNTTDLQTEVGAYRKLQDFVRDYTRDLAVQRAKGEALLLELRAPSVTMHRAQEIQGQLDTVRAATREVIHHAIHGPNLNVKNDSGDIVSEYNRLPPVRMRSKRGEAHQGSTLLGDVEWQKWSDALADMNAFLEGPMSTKSTQPAIAQIVQQHRTRQPTGKAIAPADVPLANTLARMTTEPMPTPSGSGVAGVALYNSRDEVLSARERWAELYLGADALELPSETAHPTEKVLLMLRNVYSTLAATPTGLLLSIRTRARELLTELNYKEDEIAYDPQALDVASATIFAAEIVAPFMNALFNALNDPYTNPLEAVGLVASQMRKQLLMGYSGNPSRPDFQLEWAYIYEQLHALNARTRMLYTDTNDKVTELRRLVPKSSDPHVTHVTSRTYSHVPAENKFLQDLLTAGTGHNVPKAGRSPEEAAVRAILHDVDMDLLRTVVLASTQDTLSDAQEQQRTSFRVRAPRRIERLTAATTPGDNTFPVTRYVIQVFQGGLERMAPRIPGSTPSRGVLTSERLLDSVQEMLVERLSNWRALAPAAEPSIATAPTDLVMPTELITALESTYIAARLYSTIFMIRHYAAAMQEVLGDVQQLATGDAHTPTGAETEALREANLDVTSLQRLQEATENVLRMRDAFTPLNERIPGVNAALRTALNTFTGLINVPASG